MSHNNNLCVATNGAINMSILSLNAARFTAIDACSIANIDTFKAILIDLFTEIETRQKELPRLIFGQCHVCASVRASECGC